MTTAIAECERLTPRWYQLRYHPEQETFRTEFERFTVINAGARAGKSEVVKRWSTEEFLTHPRHHPEFPRGRYLCAAPTQDQATNLWLEKPEGLLAFIPDHFVLNVRRSNPPQITLAQGTIIRIVGLDKPMRSEGEPWDGIIVDEYSECKANVWRYIRPMLSTPGREGWAVLLSRPRGAAHLKKLYDEAPMKTGWRALHWTSESILSAEEITAAKADMDELEYRSEYLAEFVTYEGRAYHAFDRSVHVKADLPYDPKKDLLIFLDFNQAPGIAVIGQEEGDVTLIIGEVYIPRGSTTDVVCEKLIEDWGKHPGRVIFYGDTTGGYGGSAKLAGSDWTIVKDMLRPVFKGRIFFRVPKQPPGERARINSLNRRLKTADGKPHLLINGNTAKHVPGDFEQTMLLEGGVGKVDKRSDLTVSHLTDAIGYYTAKEFPVLGKPKATSKAY